MSSHSTEAIRNIVLTGHAGSGKTTLAEALLHRAGAIPAPGSIAKGTTQSDFDDLEKSYGHSLDSAVLQLDFAGAHINLIDTPGYPDLFGRAMAVLPAAETCAIVINAQAGIELVARRMMHAARERGMDRLIIITHIDAADVDTGQLLEQIQSEFGRECLPLNLPADNGERVVDCFFEPQAESTDFSSVENAHTEIVDQVVELDEKLMDLYLEQGEALTPVQLHEPFEAALRDDHLVPVCFVSATTGVGIELLLRIFAELMPNPNEGNPPQFLKGEGDAAKVVTLSPDPGAHAIGHVFKISIDPFVGRLAAFRIYQGTMTRDSQLFIGDARKPFKVGHLLSLQGRDHHEVPRGIPGDICAVAKVEDVHYNAVIHDSHDEDHMHLRPLELPPPMFGLAIEAKSRGDEQKISDALHKLVAEDPSLAVEHHARLNETVIRGQGELHLRVVLEKLRSRYNIDVNTRPPKIAYRETITIAAEGHHRHKKQTGGAGQFGEVFLRIEPLPRGGGFEFVDAVVGGAIPRQFIPAVEKGVHHVMEEGAVAGYPLQDIRVTVYDGKHHSVDSKEVAFVAAGRKALLDAIAKAKPVVLEPMVEMQIDVPSESVGDITSDLSAKRGRINETQPKADGATSITAVAPLSELGNYASELKAMTAGRGSYSISFSHYDPVPSRTQQELAKVYRPSEVES